MKKQILSLSLILISFLAKAQYDYSPTGRNDVPVLGMQWGLVGGGFTAMMNNRDDINADQRLDPQAMNFSYAGGAECVYWFQRTIGFGAQALIWQGGAAYKGIDTFTKYSLSAKAQLSYLKIPLLFHFKSYNRYYPDRRVRFSAMFGPYIALLGAYKDEMTIKDAQGITVTSTTIDLNSYTSGSTGQYKGKLNGRIFNPLDAGFVAGFGTEIRLWRRTVVALHIRTDIGISNIENAKGLKLTYDNDLTHEQDFNPWKDLYAKYTSANSVDKAAGWVSNRPATKNFSAGVFLSVRKYLSY